MISALSLTQEYCLRQAKDCIALAEQPMSESHNIIIRHIAGRWEQIASELKEAAGRS